MLAKLNSIQRVAICALGAALLCGPVWIAGQPPPASPDRLDFTAAEGQADFPTPPVSPRPNIQAYRNGVLQRPGSLYDYTQQYIQGGARIRVTFMRATELGDYVTLFYYR